MNVGAEMVNPTLEVSMRSKGESRDSLQSRNQQKKNENGNEYGLRSSIKLTPKKSQINKHLPKYSTNDSSTAPTPQTIIKSLSSQMVSPNNS
jgi:hypothetical protein